LKSFKASNPPTPNIANMKENPFRSWGQLFVAAFLVIFAVAGQPARAQCTPPPVGIVSWWPGQGNAHDVIGTNNGILEGGLGFIQGEVGQAFFFNTTNLDVKIPPSASLNLGVSNGFTLEAWILCSNSAALNPIFEWNRADGTTQWGVHFYVGAGGPGTLWANVVDTNGFWHTISSPTGTIASNVFQHVALTYDQTTGAATLYCNGLIFGQANLGIFTPQTTYNLYLGHRPGPEANYTFSGLIDEPSIYNRALSADEIAAIYNSGSAGKCVPAATTSTGVPAIFSFSPAVAATGAVVELVGTNFSAVTASNIVYFGTVRANVIAATPGSLTVQVPPGASFGPVTVTVGGLTAYSAGLFEPSFAGALTNLTTANFAASFDLTPAPNPAASIMADLDGDGKPDIAVVCSSGEVISIFRNISTNGAPLSAASFAPRVDLPFPTNGTAGIGYRLQAVDLDGDGKLDLIACEDGGNRVSVFHNIGTPGALTTNSFEPAFALIAGSDCRFATAKDLDGDGRPDIVALNYGDNTISIFKNVGVPAGLHPASFLPPVTIPAPGGPYDAAIADLNGDGKPDLVVANADAGTVSIYQNTATTGLLDANSFLPPFSLGVGVNTASILVADLDGDGNLDLVAGSVQQDQFSVFRNLGSGGLLTTNSFAAPVNFGTPGWMHVGAIADFNGDGKPDLAVVGELPSYLSIFQNISTPGSFTGASFAPRVDFGTGWNAWGVSAGDLDGDGRPDIVFCNYYDSTIQIYQNQAPFGALPTISMEPTNLTVLAGATVNFTVTANGNPPPGYQWEFNGTPIPGATSATLTLTNVTVAQAGSYAVQVSNSAGSVLSSNAVLTVGIPPMPPMIVSQTGSQVALLGGTVSFSVLASGSAPLSYFWSRNGAPILNATNSSYTLFDAQLSDSGSKFSCLVTNAYGLATSTNATLKVIDTVSNDLCSGAVVIAVASYTNFQSTANASSYGDPAPDCVDGFGNGVWYQFTAPGSGLLYVDTFGSDFDTGLAAYSGSCDSLTEVACNDDAGGGVASQIIFPAAAGTTYYFLAGGYGGHVGNLVFHLNYFTPPQFAAQPTNESVVVTSNAMFTAGVFGTPPMSFQWFFNQTPLTNGGRISGATSLTLAISGVQTNDGGNYELVASNFVGVTTSSVAVLTPVVLPPYFTQLPANESVGTGSNTTFTAAVSGSAPFNYQWSLNGNALADDGVHIVGASTASLTISNVTAGDGGVYSLAVANGGGSTNVIATLTVLTLPTFTVQPVGRSVPPGLPTTFTATAGGAPAPGVQWCLNGTNIPGATAPTYAIGAVATNNLGAYTLLASNTLGVVTSAVAQLTFGPVAAWGRNLNNECLPPPGLSNVVGVAGSYANSFAVLANGNVTAWGNGPGTNIPPGATNVVAVSVNGVAGNIALRADGSVVGWQGSAVPVMSNIVAVAAGNYAGLALRADGTVQSWGNSPISPVPVGLNHISAISVGTENALALRNDGTVVAWGTDVSGTVPLGLTNVTAIAAGNVYNLALKADGTVVVWGSNSGVAPPPGLTNLTAISTINYSSTPFSLALRTNGTVVAWGDNSTGETNPPAALSNLLSVAVAAAPFHGFALVNDGSPQILRAPVGLTANVGRTVTLQASAVGAAPLSYQWLLNGTNLPGATAASLVISNVQFASAGSYQLLVSNWINTALSLPAPVNVISNNTLTFLSQNSVSASNVYEGGTATLYGGAVLGNGPLTYQWFWSPTNRGYAPVAGATNDILILNPALAVQSGYYYLAASNLLAGATSAPVNLKVQFARAWGYQAVSNPPVNITNAIAVATGGFSTYYGHYLALSADGKVSAWANYSTLYGETNVSALSNSFVTAIAAGVEDGLALKSDGTVSAWGMNNFGETNVPAGLNNVVAIACGSYHDLALKADGTVVGWGGTGQYNYGQATNNPAATNVVAIAAGAYHSLALRANGTLVGWGNGSSIYTIAPAAATNVVAIAAGLDFSEALRADGIVVQWGNLANYPVPSNLSNVVAISASGNHCTALRNDGTVASWGYGSAVSNTSNNVPSDLANVVAIASGGDHDFGLLGSRAPVFTIQPWDQSFVAGATVNLMLTGKVVGAQPVRYQWLYNGAPMNGATNDSLVLMRPGGTVGGNGFTIMPGAYQLVASNAYATVTSRPAKISQLIPLATALNNSTLVWSTTGNALWYGQTNYSHDGVSAARSGGIGGDQESILQTTLVTNYAGTVSFWWNVSSEQFFDLLEFRLNSISLTNISGVTGWQQVSIPVLAGTNLLQWRYAKDPSVDSGLDAGFVDQVSFIPNAPQILAQPVGILTNAGANITLNTSATGAPTMGYQWWQNGNPVGGNSPILTLNHVGRAQNGVYFVTVTNAGGATASSNAVVHISVPQVIGQPKLLPGGALQFASGDMGGGALSPSDLANFEAQASTNLIDWITLTNALSLTNGMLMLQDQPVNHYTDRYYRIIEH
jgi:alpha-tubulin suppressor-like RCC1 family protein